MRAESTAFGVPACGSAPHGQKCVDHGVFLLEDGTSQRGLIAVVEKVNVSAKAA